MNRRIDYYDDPHAPLPNSLVPSVNVTVINEAGALLLIRHSDNDNRAPRRRHRPRRVHPRRSHPRDSGRDRNHLRDHRDRRHIQRPQARHPLHQQRGGATRVLYRAHGTPDRGRANSEHRVSRGPMGSATGHREPPDGPVNAHAHQPLPRSSRPVHRLSPETTDMEP